MKQGIHPDYHKIKVVMTDGSEFFVRSTYGEEGSTLTLDVDPKSHPAWLGAHGRITSRAGRVASFNTRFSGILSK